MEQNKDKLKDIKNELYDLVGDAFNVSLECDIDGEMWVEVARSSKCSRFACIFENSIEVYQDNFMLAKSSDFSEYKDLILKHL